MNVLVTGSNGQLGSEIKKVSVSTNKVKYYFTDVEELDITNIESIRAYVLKNSIECIVNCAAYTNVDKAEDDEEMADLINHKAVENLAIISKKVGILLIHVSTDYVFQGDQNLPYSEDEMTSPLGIYGITKLLGERAIQKVECQYIIFRTSWLYSEFGNNFVKTMLRLTSERSQLNVVFDQIGTPTYAADLAFVICKIIQDKLYLEYNGVYHFSNEGVCSWFDFAKEIQYLAGNSCDIQPCHSDEFPSKVKRPVFSVLDKTKLKKDFQITIPYWKDSLKKCVSLLK